MKTFAYAVVGIGLSTLHVVLGQVSEYVQLSWV